MRGLRPGDGDKEGDDGRALFFEMSGLDNVFLAGIDGEDGRGVPLDIADRIMGKKAVLAVKKDRWEKLAA